MEFELEYTMRAYTHIVAFYEDMTTVCRYIKDTLIRMTRMVDKLRASNIEVTRYRKDTGYGESLSSFNWPNARKTSRRILKPPAARVAPRGYRLQQIADIETRRTVALWASSSPGTVLSWANIRKD
jgi:hypothetical protein